MLQQKQNITDEAIMVLVQHGWNEDEAEALITASVDSEYYKDAWNKVIDQVPEASDFGLLFCETIDADFTSDPALVQRRLGLTDAEAKILAQAEALYAG